jgi:hypothetical protein
MAAETPDFSLPGCRVEYLPVKDNLTFNDQVPVQDRPLLEDALKILIGIAHHKRALTPDDPPEAALEDAAESVKWTVFPHKAADPVPYYDVVVIYPWLFECKFTHLSHLAQQGPERFDLEHVSWIISPQYKRPQLTVRVLADGWRRSKKTTVYYFDQWDYKYYSTATPLPREGVPVKRSAAARAAAEGDETTTPTKNKKAKMAAVGGE